MRNWLVATGDSPFYLNFFLKNPSYDPVCTLPKTYIRIFFLLELKLLKFSVLFCNANTINIW